MSETDDLPLYLGISIHRNARDVYDFAAAPENLSQWASGLGQTLRKVNGEWIADTTAGEVKIRFVERNAFGVLDHWVTTAQGREISIPLRVITHGDGSNLMLTLFRQPGMSDEQFEADAAWVLRDLATLKRLLETRCTEDTSSDGNSATTPSRTFKGRGRVGMG